MIAFLQLYVSSLWAWLGITVLAWIVVAGIVVVIAALADALTQRRDR